MCGHGVQGMCVAATCGAVVESSAALDIGSSVAGEVVRTGVEEGVNNLLGYLLDDE